MKKLTLVALSFVAIAAVKADYLYWMVTDDVANGNVAGVDAASSSTANPYAWIVATDGNNTYTLNGQSASAVANASEWGDYFRADLGDYSGTGYSYYIELYNGYKTAAQEYDTLLDNGYISKPGTIASPASLANGAFGQTAGTSYNVPEPTSGLLFVIGGMLLGLKRKRQV